MKQIRNKTLLAMAAAVVLLLAGCTKEPHNEGFGEGSYLSLSIDGLHSPATAASASSATLRGASTRATAVVETAVNDLWVLQFQMTAGSTTAGALVNKSYISSVTDLTKIKFTPTAGSDMALYLVANSGSTLFSATANGTTLASVKATAMTATTTAGNNFPTDASANLPMVGQSANLTLPTQSAVPVTLMRTVAKVVLTIKNPLETGYPRLTVTSTQLKNAPKTYSTQVINAANGFTGTTYYPATGASNFTDYTAVASNITAAGTTSTYYVAPNVRGISTNTNDRLKSDATAPSGQGAYCTYVEILGTAKATYASPAVDVRYRLYLGENNTNDFNLLSNTAYKVDIELTGINGNDARMRIIADKFDLVQGGTDGDHTSDAGDGWTQPAIGALKSGGIVYWVDDTDPTKFKVVALTDSNAESVTANKTPKWAANNSYVIGSGAQSDTDGRGNVAAIKSAFDNKKTTAGVAITESNFEDAFPAAAYCYNYKGKDGKDPEGTWYLPAKTELQYLWCAFNGKDPAVSWISGTNSAAPADPTAQGVFNGYLTAAGGTEIPVSGGFWSSTENSSSTNVAWHVLFSTNNTYGVAKSSPKFVRCVRDITPPPAIGDAKDGGIVYWVDPADATKYKVFSLDQGAKTWAEKNTYVLGSAGQSDTNGKGNVAAMKAYSANNTANTDDTKKTTGDFADDFPAAGFCESKNIGGVTGWYLPAQKELLALRTAYTTNKDVLDKAITANNGTAFPDGPIWSSTEYDVRTAWYVYFSSGGTGGLDKDGSRYVRCVRDL